MRALVADGRGQVKRGDPWLVPVEWGFLGQLRTAQVLQVAERESAGSFEITKLFDVSINYPRLYLRGLNRKADRSFQLGRRHLQQQEISQFPAMKPGNSGSPWVSNTRDEPNPSHGDSPWPRLPTTLPTPHLRLK
jgi:hypothetical protein